jgi:hypothetical protein
MVSTCANPECSAPFRRLRQGRLFLIDPRDRARSQTAPGSTRLEFFWLCDRCTPQFTVVVGPENEVSCVSRLEGVPCNQA